MRAGVRVPGIIGGVLALLSVAGAPVQGPNQPASPGVPATVLFVCEHGNVKSLIASQWFNRLAAEQGMEVRALSRGVTPETLVPAAIAEQLGRDGFDVTRFEPRAFAPADLEGASRIVLIGVEPPSWVGPEALPVEKWEGIPPATKQYEASRDAMRVRILALLGNLARPRRGR